MHASTAFLRDSTNADSGVFRHGHCNGRNTYGHSRLR